MEYDLIVIGLGPSGQEIALSASKLQKNVLVFEKNKVGGTCLNVGCVPTKSILHNSKNLSWTECLSKQKDIVLKFNKAVEKDFKNRGIEIIFDEATIDVDKKCVVCGGKEYYAKEIIIATGSKPFEIKGFEFNHKDILSSDDIFNMETLPKSIGIIGSGAIGIEWALIFNNLNVKVTVIEAQQNLLPSMDIDVSKRIERIFKINKIDFYKGTSAQSFENGVLKLENGVEIEAEKVLVGVGRKKVLPKIKGDKELKINENFETNYKNIYGIGDITAYPMLAHSASYQARVLMDKIYNNKELKEDALIPSVIYGEIEVASVGIKEQDIQDLNEYKIYNMPVACLVKAWCDCQTDGFIKIIVKDNKIKGAHIVSKEASSIIGTILCAMKSEMDIQDFKQIIFPHPTLLEGLHNVFEFKR